MKDALNKPTIIKGDRASDNRGQLSFVNKFNFKGVKRFYVVDNVSVDVIRAFHGHKKEAKYAYVSTGSAVVAAVKMDDIKSPSKKNKVHRFELSAKEPRILHIPSGYANGFKFLEKKSKIIFFSTASLEESKKDDYRFPHDYWGKDIWKNKSKKIKKKPR